MNFADNKLHPLQIEDARESAFRASELQRQVEDELRRSGGKLAEAERLYRLALTTKIEGLHSTGVAWTACETLAKGDTTVAGLRKARDDAKVEVEVIQQQAYRRAADRKALERLLSWSMARDLRTDPEPAGELVTFGDRRAS